ncbi:YaaA family protein [Veillonella sp.]|mgnify:FL=1|uniref:YaaA family protein n=1 Tax=Veillonella sp. TaxID=1926307 RepID=UPI002900FEF5|nr:YaaA family protein [Veillonella sp.]MDU2207750.1 YaaA family protein [Veillonella sp.]
MKIVLSPSKTKRIPDTAVGVRDGQFQPRITQKIVKHVQSLDVASLGKALKLKDDKAQALFDFYKEFESYPVGFACESYDGIAFKYLDWAGLSDEAKNFGKNHLVIMSALYGVVEPTMGVRDYRLDMVDKVGMNLYETWREAVDAYFHKEDWILNLASKEYAKMVNHPKVVTIEFWELRGDTYKQMSTSSKMSRGMMAHACLTKQVRPVRDLPREINGFICSTDIESITIPSESMTVRYERK